MALYNEREDVSKWSAEECHAWMHGDFVGYWRPEERCPYSKHSEPSLYDKWFRGWAHGAARAMEHKKGNVTLRKEITYKSILGDGGEI